MTTLVGISTEPNEFQFFRGLTNDVPEKSRSSETPRQAGEGRIVGYVAEPIA